MLYYNKISDSEGIHKSEGQDCVGITNLKSRQCYRCLYYFYITENLKYLMSDIKIVSLLLWTIKNTFNFTFKKTTLSQPWNKKNEIMVLLFLETCHFALFSFTICSFPFKNIIRWKWGNNQWEQLKHVKITSI